jgi:putative membrane protein
MKQMVADHKKVVKEFEKEAKSGKDPDVKAWAEKTLPSLRDHLSEAENLYNSVKGNSATTTEPKGVTTPTKKSGS